MLKSVIKKIREKISRPEQAFFQDDNILIKNIQEKKLTYLSKAKLISIANTCRSIEIEQLPGVFIEAGVALGGSSILISKTKEQTRAFYMYDVFEMIPPPTKEDTQDVHTRYRTIIEGKSLGIDGDKYYGYQENLHEIVKKNLEDFHVFSPQDNVFLIKGLLQDTMTINQPVAFAHIDVDWYDPVLTCLKRIFPYLVSGGCIIIDDYHDWGGCRKACDEYLRTIVGEVKLDDKAGALKIIKK